MAAEFDRAEGDVNLGDRRQAWLAVHLDETTRKQIDRGQRITELLKQGQYRPLSVGLMAASLFAVSQGYLDTVELSHIPNFEAALHDYLQISHATLIAQINQTGDYDAAVQTSLKSALEAFRLSHTW